MPPNFVVVGKLINQTVLTGSVLPGRLLLEQLSPRSLALLVGPVCFFQSTQLLEAWGEPQSGLQIFLPSFSLSGTRLQQDQIKSTKFPPMPSEFPKAPQSWCWVSILCFCSLSRAQTSLSLYPPKQLPGTRWGSACQWMQGFSRGDEEL